MGLSTLNYGHRSRVLAQHLTKQLPFDVTSQHVRGHQDSKRRSIDDIGQKEESDCDSLATTESTKLKEIDLSKLKDEAL